MKDPEMDITRKLELIANLKPGDPWPSADLGGNEFNYAPAISAMCSEALAEIQRLRQDEGYRSQGMYMLMPSASQYVEWSVVNDPTGWSFTPTTPSSLERQWPKVFGKTSTQVIVDDPHAEREQAEKTIAGAWVPQSGTAIGKLDPNQLKPSTPSEPVPEPWGSPFAMNTENWK
jgi:hypothetical protein